MSFLDLLPLDFLSQQDPIPRPRILSSQTRLQLIIDTIVYDMGEVDGFKKEKKFNKVKQWKPWGSKYEKILIEDAGWDISFSGGKVDWKLGYLIYIQEKLLTGMDNSNFGVTWNDVKSLYNKPIFVFIERTTYYDGTIEEYKYNNVTLLTYDDDDQGNNDQIIEHVSAFAESRDLISSLNDSKQDVDDLISKIMQEINQKGMI